MHLHILGICGTFMGGLALLARALGHRVTGSDAGIYPPMSEQLAAAGIEVMEGFHAAHLEPAPDLVLVGNAMTRGVPAVEHMLNFALHYRSGPQWLGEQVLAGRHVLAVAGTHGKTTTASMLAWILADQGLDPGFLIGGVPLDFDGSARLGGGRLFVVEADEYDTAFFDKRSKFVHYRPRTLILNNLEFDHADIFDNLAMIQRQFHHLVRMVPSTGLIVHPLADPVLEEVLAMGCWTPLATTGAGGDWSARIEAPDGSDFRVLHRGRDVGGVNWAHTGRHNVQNALSAVAAAAHVGVAPGDASVSLTRFQGVRRRMELRGEVGGIKIYDDFAHHPTAIATTLEGLRLQVGEARIIAVLEPRSNTMRMGVHREALASALMDADVVLVHASPALGWDATAALSGLGGRLGVFNTVGDIVNELSRRTREGDHIVIMSNGGFEGIHERVLTSLGG